MRFHFDKYEGRRGTIFACCLLSAAALAQPKQCSSIDDDTARLACYDRLYPATRSENLVSDVSASASARNLVPRPEKKAEAVATFGLEGRAAPVAVLSEIVSQVEGRFEGWASSTRWRFANGQVWAIADGSNARYDIEAPRIRIVRGAFGSYFLEVDGVSQSPKVRRLQ
jgi:hypothetical protein